MNFDGPINCEGSNCLGDASFFIILITKNSICYIIIAQIQNNFIFLLFKYLIMI